VSGRRTVSNEQKLLDAISTLKRVTGVPNSKTKTDECHPEGRIQVYTTDLDSAQILSNLISQSLMKVRGHTEKYWSKPERFGEFHDLIKIHPTEDKEYRVYLSYPPIWTRAFIENINEKTQLLTAPDNRKR
jgi:hypothetical protein